MSTTLDAGHAPAPREITTNPRTSDKIFRGVVTGFGMTALLILTLIGLFLSVRGLQTIHSQGFGFLTRANWEVVQTDAGATYNLGVGAMLIGTVIISIIALVIGVPLSVALALFLTFYAPARVKTFLVSVVDLMAAFPSVLYGLWGFFVLMPLASYWAKIIFKYLNWIPIFDAPQYFFERSPFIAGLVLSIMIIPIVTSVSREVFAQTPLDRIQAAYALGATKWGVIKTVVFPFGSSGVIGGAMLGLGRAFGETVAVYSVLNIVFKVNIHVLYGSGGNVASMIIQKWGESTGGETTALLAAGFILFLLTLLVNLGANFIVRNTLKSGK
ncbi:PstC ABC-type phosphate transport system, permease component [Candidatus Nanopelagicaceae bacterium]